MIYLRNWGRPFGVEPILFTSKKDAEVSTGEDNLFGDPEILEFDSELEARRFIKKNYPTIYQELKIF